MALDEREKAYLAALAAKKDAAASQYNQQVANALKWLGNELKTTKDAVQEVAKSGGRAPSAEGDPSNQPVDLDGMSRGEFAQWMLQQVGSEVIKPLREEMGSDREATNRDRVKAELQEVQGKYKDFLHFRDEIRREVEARPDLSLEDAYHLARLHNEDKTRELDEAAQAEEAEQKQKEEDASFGGMFPTSGGSASTNQRMSRDDAAQSAWEEHMAPFSRIFSSGSTH